MKNDVMLNAYPDSIGNQLSDTIQMLNMEAFKGAFSHFYILPTFFNSDLDRGFSIIDYDLNSELVSEHDLEVMKSLNLNLKFDIVLNHLSVNSTQFKDMVEHGDESVYKDFFINWNEFWEGNGEMGADGIIMPKSEYLDKLFMRKSGLPILKVEFPDGSLRPYWNTFYQKVWTENGKTNYLGQMDVNANSPLVWEFIEETLAKISTYGCQIVRLDAFAYLHKAVGEVNFFNKPGTWDYLSRINELAKKYNLILLPEIHAEYGAYLHDEVASKGYMIYDFFLPGLTLHAIENGTSKALISWAKEVISKDYKTVNMLGCHDGIPVIDLKGKGNNTGLISDNEIEELIHLVLSRGGKVKNLYGVDGKKVSYYQLNSTYFSALGENENKMILARAIQLFMPGIPQIWYLDLFAGKNDYKAVEIAGADGHKEINRTNLTIDAIKNGLQTSIVQRQLELIRLRNTHRAFNGNPSFDDSTESEINIKWENGLDFAHLTGNLKTHKIELTYTENNSTKSFNF
jgi:sucrose phosphorylase